MAAAVGETMWCQGLLKQLSEHSRHVDSRTQALGTMKIRRYDHRFSGWEGENCPKILGLDTSDEKRPLWCYPLALYIEGHAVLLQD